MRPVLGLAGRGNKVAVPKMPWREWIGGAAQGLATAREGLFNWFPLIIGAAIAIWFALPTEPGMVSYAVALALVAGAVILFRRGPDAGQPIAAALLCLAIGWLACGVRVWTVSSPMLDFRYYGPVTGRVVEIDRSQSDALRLTLDRVWLDRVRPRTLPERVRVALRSREAGHIPKPGEVVMLTANLSAPAGPVEPGAFDFRRMAFFNRLGAVGYSTSPVMLWQPPEPLAVPVDRLRSYLSNAMIRAMPSQAGAFATGAMTGDRSAITQETVQALRDSSLAHLLAISGMNLAFLIGFVFALIRYGLALVPWLALRVNSKKVAAVVSLAVAAFYLALSGSNVATERAFIMVAVMLGAVLLDRKALTLRSVAIAGTILLLWKPEALLEPGFQMSFAATVALIAGFREVDRMVVVGRLPVWARPVFTLVLSSLIGGLATAPFAAAHFNRFADYGLVANLLTVPVMGAVVMPSGAIAALLAPVGLAQLPLWTMEMGAAWILMIANLVAGWDGAVTAIPSPGPWVLPCVTLAGAGLVLWRGAWRGLAALPATVALGLWIGGARPDALVSDDGALVGVVGHEGRVLSSPRGAGFAARNWLENDGDLVSQAIAAERPGMSGETGERHFRIGPVSGVALRGKGAEQRLAAACAQADLVVIAAVVASRPGDCLLLDRGLLQESGGLALTVAPEGVYVRAVRDARRAWSPAAGRREVPRLILPRSRTMAEPVFSRLIPLQRPFSADQ